MDEQSRTIVSRKMATEENSVKIRQRNRNRRSRSSREVSAPSRKRTFPATLPVSAHRAYYSYLRACVGAILHALRAGTYAASMATRNSDGTTIK